MAVTITKATLPGEMDIVRNLFAEYLRWLCSRLCQEFGVVVDPESMLMKDLDTIDIFLPPKGLLFLSFDNEVPAGCSCVRTIANGIAELKRVYVRTSFRGQGIGAALVQTAIREVKQLGYLTMRLDSAKFMSDAHRLYRSLGFREVIPNEGSDVPKGHQDECVFMQLDLLLNDEGASLC